MTKKFDKYKKFGAYHWNWYRYKESYRTHVDKVVDWVKGKDVIDIGAGDGLITHKLGIKGVDIDPLAVKLAKEKGVDVIVGDACDLPFKNRQFYSAFMGDTLEHIKDAKKALEEARRVIKKYLYLAQPIRLYQQKGEKEGYDYHSWTLDEVELLVESVGFELKEWEVVVRGTGSRAYCKFLKVKK
jgi:SAM-dependent methyltransferase